MKHKLLSILLCLAMALSLLPTAALADGEGATGTTITTSEALAAAIANAQDGATITLGEGTFTTYGNASPKKSLTFVGSGTGTVWKIGNLDSTTGGEGNGDYSFDGCNTITFKDMTLKSDGKDYRGFIRINNTVVDNCTIDGKTAYWGYNTAKFQNGTIFIAPEGDYALWDYSSKSMTFDNCEFNISGKGVHVYIEAGNAGSDARTVTVKDCTVNSTKENKAFLNIKNSTQAYEVEIAGNNNVTGLSADTTTGSNLYQVETTTVTETSGKPVKIQERAADGALTTVYEVEAPAVAKIGDTEYPTLAAAVAAAKDDETVTLLKDTDISKTGLTIYARKSITLDLSGHSLKAANTNDGNIKVYGTLTLTDSTDTAKNGTGRGKVYTETPYSSGSQDKVLIAAMGGGTFIMESGLIDAASNITNNADNGQFAVSVQNDTADATVIINGGKIKAGWYAVAGNGNDTSYSGDITVNGGILESTADYAIYHPHTGTTTINGGTVYGAAGGVSLNRGKLVVNGGTITSKGTGTTGDWGDGTGNQEAAAINVNAKYETTSVEIKGGKITAENNAIVLTNGRDGTIAVSGGTFSSEVKAEYCAPGFESKTNSDGTYGVKINENMAAEVLDAQGKTVGAYDTLAAAITAAKNGETVKLLKDVDENVTIPAGKSITLDLNGKTINGGTGTSSAAITNYGTVTITDSSTEKAGTIKRSDIGTEGETSYYVIRNLGKMTITAANVINNSGYAKTNPSGSMVGSSLICNGDGDAPATLTINGGAFEQQNFIVVKNGSFGILNVNGGKFTSKHSAIQNWYKADIKGGEINGQLWTDAWQEGSSVGETKIGGTAKFTGEILMDITGSVKPTLEISGGEMIVSNWRITWAAADKGAKPVITGGNFSQPVKREYLDSSLNAELKRASGDTPYSYYTSVAAATAAAKPGDTVTDLNATTEQKVTLTLKYNDGATADTTYNVASGTTITLPAPAHRSGYTFNGWYDGSTKVSSSYKVTKNVTLTASWSYNYSGGSSSYDPTYSVSTPSKTKNGTVTVSPKNASKGDTVTVTVKPDSGYVLETLTVTDKNGNELTLKDKGNGKYTFTMPAGKVEVKATFMEDNSMLNFFYDVPNGAYFYEAVKWAVENGITTGVGNDLFAPEQPCTRAQIVTFLWRAAGSPEPKGAASGMTDVVSGSYYEKAVAWAIENGITTGTTTSTFSPDATCTRAQAVTFLARALNAKAASAAEFSDVPTGSYFADAVAWAAANGVTEGIGGGLFGSDNDCTRGQIVTFLYRAYNK